MTDDERLAIAQRLNRAWMERDTSVLSELDADFRFIPAIAGAVDEHGVGRDELLKFLEEVDATWESFEVENREYQPVGDSAVLILNVVHAVGRGSGIAFDRELPSVMRFRGDKAIELRSFFELDEALEYANEKEPA